MPGCSPQRGISCGACGGSASRRPHHWPVADTQDRGDLQRQIDQLAQRVTTNREMIAELQAEGLVSHEHAEQLEQALRSSRTIGAAIGIIMASRRVTQDRAFAILTRLSQDTNRKLRDVAAELVQSAEDATQSDTEGT